MVEPQDIRVSREAMTNDRFVLVDLLFRYGRELFDGSEALLDYAAFKNRRRFNRMLETLVREGHVDRLEDGRHRVISNAVLTRREYESRGAA